MIHFTHPDIGRSICDAKGAATTDPFEVTCGRCIGMSAFRIAADTDPRLRADALLREDEFFVTRNGERRTHVAVAVKRPFGREQAQFACGQKCSGGSRWIYSVCHGCTRILRQRRVRK